MGNQYQVIAPFVDLISNDTVQAGEQLPPELLNDDERLQRLINAKCIVEVAKKNEASKKAEVTTAAGENEASEKAAVNVKTKGK
jgi:hypothetical protein